MIGAKDIEIGSYNSCSMEHTVRGIHENKNKCAMGFTGTMKEVGGQLLSERGT